MYLGVGRSLRSTNSGDWAPGAYEGIPACPTVSNNNVRYCTTACQSANDPPGGTGWRSPHGARGRCENRIKTLKNTGLGKLPFYDFAANQAWANGTAPGSVDSLTKRASTRGRTLTMRTPLVARAHFLEGRTLDWSCRLPFCAP